MEYNYKNNKMHFVAVSKVTRTIAAERIENEETNLGDFLVSSIHEPKMIYLKPKENVSIGFLAKSSKIPFFSSKVFDSVPLGYGKQIDFE